MTLQWKEVFFQLDQWDTLPKLQEIHPGANSGMTATWLARLCSPNVAHLVVDTAGEIQLFHHFQHDINNGLNDKTNQLWALQDGSSMAQAVSIRPDQLSFQKNSFAIEWTTMTAGNSRTTYCLRSKEELRHMHLRQQGPVGPHCLGAPQRP
jgi:TRAP-type mannitol/chloroaromatic compound transport system substrate-binding protein